MIRWSTHSRSLAETRRRAAFERWMEIYWCSAQAWWESAEHETQMYPEELRLHKQDNPQPTLKDYMIQTRGELRYL